MKTQLVLTNQNMIDNGYTLDFDFSEYSTWSKDGVTMQLRAGKLYPYEYAQCILCGEQGHKYVNCKTYKEEFKSSLAHVVATLNELERDNHYNRLKYSHPADLVTAKVRSKFVAIDVKSSGAWLVERKTGEIYNIKGYGVADYNKKQKANLGNIFTVDIKNMHEKRWTYLR
jgi:hypothetical protein